MIILSLQGVQKSFGTHEVLREVTFALQERDRMGLVGVNGCGKSTLMKIIAGEETADAGKRSFGNWKFRWLPHRIIRRTCTGWEVVMIR